MGPAVNRDNHELVLSDFALCACEYEFQLPSGASLPRLSWKKGR